MPATAPRRPPMTSGRERRDCRLGARLERPVSAGAGPVRGGSVCGDRGRAGAGSRSQPLKARFGFVGNPWGDGRCVALSCKRCGLQAGTRTLAVVFLFWGSLVKGGWLRLNGPRGKVTAARESKAGGLSGKAPGWGRVGSGRAPPDQSPFRGVVPAPDLRFCPTVHGPCSSGAASSSE